MDIYTYMYLIGTLLLFTLISLLIGYFRPSDEGLMRFPVLLGMGLLILLLCFSGTIVYFLPRTRFGIALDGGILVGTSVAGTFWMSYFIELGRKVKEKAASSSDPWLKELN